MPPRVTKDTFDKNPFEPTDPGTVPSSDGAEETPPWEDKPAETPKVEVVKPTQVIGSPEKLTVTLKAGPGYDVPWVVIHGATPSDILETMSDEDFTKLLTWTARAGKAFGETWQPAAQPAPVGGQGNLGAQRPGTPSNAQSAPGGEVRYCAHGEMVHRTGVSAKTGKGWSGFFCPTPKGTPGQCEAQFLR